MADGSFSYSKSSPYSSFVGFLGLDVGNRGCYYRGPDPRRLQNLLRPYQTGGTAGRISQLRIVGRLCQSPFFKTMESRPLSHAATAWQAETPHNFHRSLQPL